MFARTLCLFLVDWWIDADTYYRCLFIHNTRTFKRARCVHSPNSKIIICLSMSLFWMLCFIFWRSTEYYTLRNSCILFRCMYFSLWLLSRPRCWSFSSCCVPVCGLFVLVTSQLIVFSFVSRPSSWSSFLIVTSQFVVVSILSRPSWWSFRSCHLPVGGRSVHHRHLLYGWQKTKQTLFSKYTPSPHLSVCLYYLSVFLSVGLSVCLSLSRSLARCLVF